MAEAPEREHGGGGTEGGNQEWDEGADSVTDGGVLDLSRSRSTLPVSLNRREERG